MNKEDAIREVIDMTTNEPIIFTTGYSCRIAKDISDRPNHFYMTGSMGLAANIGTGVALASRLPVVVVDGDGSLAMNPSALLAAGALPGLRLVHLVLDDRSYESTGGQRVPSRHIEFCDLARSSGYSQTVSTESLAGLRQALREAIDACSAPVLLHCRLSATEASKTPPPRIGAGLEQHRARFAAHLNRVMEEC